MTDPKEFPTMASEEVFELAGGYPVMRLVGEGGMGRVFACRDQALNRIVAVKEMLPERAKDKEMVARFLREARTMASVASPHVVSIFHVDDGSEGKPPCIVMEFLDGEDLDARLKRTGRVPVARTLDYMRDAASGLRAAAAAGLIHRDIKPGNLVVVDGSVKITDFGLAKPVDGSADLTRKGLIAGTPWFMPPERARGEDEDLRADIYALGATWFNLLAGHPPFDKETPVDTITAHLAEPVPVVQEHVPDVPAEVAGIVEKMLQKEPADRFQTYDELLDAIESASQLVDPDAQQPQTIQPRAVVVDGGDAAAAAGGGLKDTFSGASAAVSGAFGRVKEDKKMRLVAIAATAVVLLAVVLLVVLGGGGDDALARIDSGEGQAVIDEIAALPGDERTPRHDLLRGHAHAALGQDRAALDAYGQALAGGELDERAVDFALTQLEERKADAAIELLIEAPGEHAKKGLYALSTAEGWWPRHHSVYVLEKRGEDGDVDRLQLAITDVKTGPTCGTRRYGLNKLGEYGEGSEEALAALEEAAARDDNGCLKKLVPKVKKKLGG